MIDLVAAGYSAAMLDAEDLDVVFGGRLRSLGEQPVDRGEILLTFLDGADHTLGTVLSTAPNSTDRWHLGGDRAQIRLTVVRVIVDEQLPLVLDRVSIAQPINVDHWVITKAKFFADDCVEPIERLINLLDGFRGYLPTAAFILNCLPAECGHGDAAKGRDNVFIEVILSL